MRIGADEDVVLDHRAVLAGAVVVAGDGAGAYVDVPADGGVADVSKMVRLGAVGHRAVLHFDEIADMNACAQLGAGAQARVGSDDAAGTGFGILDVAEGGDARAGADDGIFQHTMRTDLDAVAEDNTAFEDAAHVDRHVTAAVELAAHVDPVGVEQRDALLHEQQGVAVLVQALQFGQLHLAVHAEHFPGSIGLRRRHRHAFVDRQPHDVGEVVLALRVVVVQGRQPAQQRRGRRDHETRVDLGQGALLIGSIPFLDDALDAPFLVAHDAAIAARFFEVFRQDAKAGTGQPDQARQGRRADQRNVAVEHQRRRIRIEESQCLQDGVSGTQLRLLPDPDEVIGIECLAHRLAAVSIHDADATRSQLARRVQHMGQQRTAAQTVQHLGQVGAHALALAGGEDDDVHDRRIGLRRENSNMRPGGSRMKKGGRSRPLCPATALSAAARSIP